MSTADGSPPEGVRPMDPDKTPAGHTLGFESDAHVESIPDDATVSICLRIKDGMPLYPNRVTVHECKLCNEPVWRSTLADPEMIVICYPCAQRIMPGTLPEPPRI